MAPERIRIGQVRKVNPGRRELRIAPEPVHRDQFNRAMEWIRLTPPGGAEMRCKVASCRMAGGHAVVALAAGAPRDVVEAMSFAEAALAPDEMAPRDPEEYPAEALLGMRVIDPAGAELGVGMALYAAGGHVVLEVEKPEGGRFRFPVVAPSIARIDFEAGELHVPDLTPFRVDDDDAD